MKKLTFIFFLVLIYAQVMAQNPLWMRYPAISPDGQTIVFSYKGDLYKVSAQGGTATPLTLHKGHDYMPVWSKDGRKIAFASDRFGNFDVYVIDIQGGAPTRLTYHSSSDYPSDFTDDNQHVIFTSSRLDAASNRLFPSGAMPELYQVPVKQGKVKQVLTVPAERARLSSDGTKLIYHDRKGYEDALRKHHTSSIARDIWTYDFTNNEYTQLSSFSGEDRNPVFAPGNQEIYYLSEEKGSLNIFKLRIDNPRNKQQITQFEDHPVRHLSSATNGKLCFTYNGEIYTLNPGQSPSKVNIKIFADDKYNAEEIISIRDGATQMAVSPNGKEVAFIARGEVFVASVESGLTKRVTNTPEQERTVDFSPDGRSLVYASERDNSWNLYQTSLSREEEEYFFNSTVLKEEPILVSEQECFQPAYSPDGKEVAYLEERTTLKVINLTSKASRLILSGDKNYSYSDGDQYYEWSPDGKWFLVNFLPPNQWISEVGLVSSQGNQEVINLTKSGYSDGQPRWMMDGKMFIWFSDRDGMKNHASWGAETDVYGMFFTQEAFDKFKLNKEEYALDKEKAAESSKEKKDDSDKKEEDKTIQMELEDITDRKARLTIHPSILSDALVSKDGEKLYYLARFEKGFDLWTTNLRTKETKILVKLNARSGGSLTFDKKGKYIFMLSGGNITRIDVASGKRKKVSYHGEMHLDRSKERAYMFEHMWRQVKKKFYVANLHEVKWDFFKQEYQRFLPHIDNNYDYSEMMSELLGELNASHTGCRYFHRMKNAASTASLGLYYDNEYTGQGLKIEEIMKGSPVAKSNSKIKAGVIIEKIDGQSISPEANFYQLLDRKAGKYTLLSLYDETSKERWEETVKPISIGTEYNLRYKRWVENCRKMTEELSDGRIGYVHVRGMNDRSFRTVYEKVLGENANKEALVVDTRFNGGGWLHDDLATFLNGKKYLNFMPRGQQLGAEPQFKWTKPSVVVMSESNYSDAHMFPFVYKELGIGKLIGMPVPGTGTAVWWERLQDPTLVFGIPQVGMQTLDGKFLENTQLEPDIKVMLSPREVSKGKDEQISRAVKVLMDQL